MAYAFVHHRGISFIFKDSVCLCVLCGEIAINLVHILNQ